jgi:rubrerythrin
MNTSQPEVTRTTLEHAIQIETRNEAVYTSLARLFEGYEDSVAGIFQEMAVEERQHGAQLEERYRERFGSAPAPGSGPAEVIEGPDLEDPEAMIFDSMTIVQALEVGLHAEQAARQFYAREVGRVADPGLKALYRELAEFEEGHVRRLETKLAERRQAGQLEAR